MKKHRRRISEQDKDDFVTSVVRKAKISVEEAIKNIRDKGMGHTSLEDDIPAINQVIDLLAEGIKWSLIYERSPARDLEQKKWEDFKNREEMQGLLFHIFDRLKDEAWKECEHDGSEETRQQLDTDVDRLKHGESAGIVPTETQLLLKNVMDKLKKKRLLHLESRLDQEKAYFGLAQAALAVTLLSAPLPSAMSRDAGSSPRGLV